MDRRRDRKSPWSVYEGFPGVAYINTRIGSTRIRESLGVDYVNPEHGSARDVRAMEEAAARRYADLVRGRVLEPGSQARVLTSSTLDELASTWLVEAKKLWPKGWKTRETQLRNVATWAESAPRFAKDTRSPLERIADDVGPQQFATDRLGSVMRDTVTKEISNLFTFLKWAKAERHISALPPRAELPRTAQGTRSGKQRAKPVDVTHAEALAICQLLPAWARRGARGAPIPEGGPIPKGAFACRDVFRLSYELGLRPGEVQLFSVPEHWMPGQRYVQFTADTNKTGSEDRIPLTAAALEILERHAPTKGVIFGVHDLRVQIKRAAAKVLGAERAKGFAAYDFRHARAVTALEVTGDLLGTSRLLRHTQLTTTNRYLRTREKHVETVIAALDASVRARSEHVSGSSEQRLSTSPEVPETSTEVRRRGLEPLRCYPLAPQEGADEFFREVVLTGLCQSTSENVGGCHVRATCWSDSGQSQLQVDIRRLRVEWDALDGYALALASAEEVQ